MIIAIIVPTYNRKNSLRKLLLCIANQNIRELELCIVVVDDGSTDDTYEMIKKEFPDVFILIGTGNWWFTKSLNEGIKYSLKFKPEYILTLNDDCIIENDFIQNLLDSVKNKPMDSIVCASSITQTQPHLILFSGVKKIIKWRLKSFWYISPMQRIKPMELQGVHSTLTVWTRGLLVPTKTMLKLNFFDERFVQYGSDEDFGHRAVKVGIPTFVSWDAKVFDDEKLTSKGTARNKPQFLEFIFSFFNPHSVNSISKTMLFYWKHGIKILSPVYFLIIIAGTFYVYFWKYRSVKTMFLEG